MSIDALARVAQPQATDYDVLRLAYSDYAEDRGKPSSRAIRRRNLSTYMSICDRALSWLREAHPDLRTLDVAAVEVGDPAAVAARGRHPAGGVAPPQEPARPIARW